MFRKLFIHQTDHGFIQLFRYGLVVAVAAPIDLGGYILLTSHFHLYVVLSSVISFSVSLIANYLLSVRWVWTGHSSRQKHIDAIIFCLIGFVGLGITAFFVWVFTHFAGLNYIVAKLITFVIVFFWSFGSRRYLFTGRLLKLSVADE